MMGKKSVIGTLFLEGKVSGINLPNDIQKLKNQTKSGFL